MRTLNFYLFRWLGIVLVSFSLMASGAELRVLTENFPPYNFERQGQIAGKSTEIVRRILEESGVSYSLLLLPWTRAYQTALEDQSGQVMIFSMTRTSEREPLFQWVHRLAAGELALFSLQETLPVTTQQIQSGKTGPAVCVYQDASCDWLRSLGFENDLLVEVPDNQESSEIRMVLAGRVAFFATNPISLEHRLEQLRIPHDAFVRQPFERKSKGLYLAASRSVPVETIRRITAAIRRLEQEQSTLEVRARY